MEEKQSTRTFRWGLAWGLIGLAGLFAVAGDLEPPGPPAPTMKTLQEVEPRTPVQSLAPGGVSVHRIDSPGSYYLTGDIEASFNISGIEIAASDVAIDLNGFTIRNTNSGSTAKGIVAGNPASSHERIRIHGGRIVDFDGGGIEVFGKATIRDLWIQGTDREGIEITQGGVVQNCRIEQAKDGIRVVGPSRIVDNEVFDSVTDGIIAFNPGGSVIAGNRIENSGQHGVNVFGVGDVGARVIDNHVTGSVNTGLFINALNCLVIRNTLAGNTTDLVGGGLIGTLVTTQAELDDAKNDNYNLVIY